MLAPAMNEAAERSASEVDFRTVANMDVRVGAYREVFTAFLNSTCGAGRGRDDTADWFHPP
jgi:hypothetical protein